jgi:hypothetical protein
MPSVVLWGMGIDDLEASKNDQQPSIELSTEDADKYISKIVIEYESDYEIKIKLPKKTAQTYPHHIVGFRKSTDLGWTTLIEIIKGSGRRYSLDCPAHINVKFTPIDSQQENGKKLRDADGSTRIRNREYDRKIQRLKDINQKLCTFFRDTLGLGIPNRYKLYELAKTEGRGVYCFKFNRPLETTNTDIRYISGLTKDEAKEKLSKLHREMTINPYNHKKLDEMTTFARKAENMGILNEGDIKQIISKDH